MTDQRPVTIQDFTRLIGMIKRDGDDLRTELRSQLGSHNMILQAVQVDVRQLKESVRKLQTTTGKLEETVGELQETVGGLQSTTSKLEQSVGEIKTSVYRLEVLNEDFDDRMKADGELLRDNLNVKAQVTDHETRLTNVESLQTILRGTVREHSKKLKTV